MRTDAVLYWSCAVALALVMAAAAAHGHGGAAWIQADSRYVDRVGVHCCGPTDCAPATAGEMRRIEGGWLHVPTNTSLMDGAPGVYRSLRPQSFRCVRGGELKCFFPAAGM